MIYLYKDLIKKGYSDYQIKKLVQNCQLYMVEKGVYSVKEVYDPLEVITKKHPSAIITLETACYCYKLLSDQKLPYVIATKQKDRKILDERVKQIFMTDSLYPIGKSAITYQSYPIHIYDLERLLIEVVRNKTSIEYETYQEIIKSYQKLSRLLNIEKLNSYIKHFKDSKIMNRIEKEVFQK